MSTNNHILKCFWLTMYFLSNAKNSIAIPDAFEYFQITNFRKMYFKFVNEQK